MCEDLSRDTTINYKDCLQDLVDYQTMLDMKEEMRVGTMEVKVTVAVVFQGRHDGAIIDGVDEAAEEESEDVVEDVETSIDKHLEKNMLLTEGKYPYLHFPKESIK